MLNEAEVSAILPSTDMKNSKEFYVKIGLKFMEMPMDDPMIFQAGMGSKLIVYYRPEGTKAEHTVAGFNVKDLDATISALEANGVIFEDYDMPGLKTVNHIMDYGGARSAWFKDPTGNILALTEM